MHAKEKACMADRNVNNLDLEEKAILAITNNKKKSLKNNNQMNKLTLCPFQMCTDALCIQRNLLVHHCRLQVV